MVQSSRASFRGVEGVDEMNDEKLIEELKKFIKAHENQKNAAKALGVSEQHISDLIHRRRTFSEKMASKFGYKAEWILDPPLDKR